LKREVGNGGLPYRREEELDRAERFNYFSTSKDNFRPKTKGSFKFLEQRNLRNDVIEDRKTVGKKEKSTRYLRSLLEAGVAVLRLNYRKRKRLLEKFAMRRYKIYGGRINLRFYKKKIKYKRKSLEYKIFKFKNFF